MRRHRSNTVSSFSASAVDLLSCGLAGAAVLWLLVLPNSGYTGDGSVERVNGVVRLSQFGTAHLLGANGNTPSVEFSFPGELPSKHQVDFSGSHFEKLSNETVPGEVIFDASGGDNGFAAQAAIVFRNVKPGTKVYYRFEPCEAVSEPHAITLMVVDRRAPRTELLFWQELSALEESLKDTSTSNTWFSSLVATLETKPKAYMGPTAHLTRLHAYSSSVSTPTPQVVLEIKATDSGTISVTVVSLENSTGEQEDKAKVEREELLKMLSEWCDNHSGATPNKCKDI